MSRLALLTVTTLLALAGCTGSGGGGSEDPGGSDGATSPSSSTTKPPTGPDCADVWKAGATLPKNYSACVTGGVRGAQEVTKCDDGSKLVAFADAYFAITGGRITKPDIAPMQDTPEYGKAYTACTGE